MKEHQLINKIGIIGAGIIGLSTANIVQKRYPDAEIYLNSDKFYDAVTSWGAPGFVRLNVDEQNYENSFRWYTKGLDHYWKLYRNPDREISGILVTSFYFVSDDIINFPSNYGNLYYGYRKVDSRELAAVGFSSKFQHGVSFVSTIVESRYYLKYLSDNFSKNGGKIIHRNIEPGKENVANWAEINNYDLIFNCTGLGSRELFDDNEIVPLRGQLVRVKAPWFKYSFVTTDGTYAYSCRDSVVLGGFRQKNDYNQQIRSNETENILKRINEHNKCLANSPIVEEWAGLRPYRPILRLEIEYIKSSSGSEVPVIHNYGHGSSGIGLSWGTSMEAVDLINHIGKKIMCKNVIDKTWNYD